MTAEGAKEVLHGVTLEQYAGVTAALLEGFSLAEVLKSERLDEGAWPRACAGWSGRLARGGAGGSASVEYQEKLWFARAWLGRRVAPLDDDLAAWMGFLGAWTAHAAPFDLLASLSLSTVDVGRIQGLWSKRLEASEALREQQTELAKAGPRAIPRVKVTLASLRPFPWSNKAMLAEVSAVRTEVPDDAMETRTRDKLGGAPSDRHPPRAGAPLPARRRAVTRAPEAEQARQALVRPQAPSGAAPATRRSARRGQPSAASRRPCAHAPLRASAPVVPAADAGAARVPLRGARDERGALGRGAGPLPADARDQGPPRSALP